MGENTGKNRNEGRLPGMPFLPVRLNYGNNDQPLEFDLNRMPHLSVTGGTPECQASVIRQILQYWEYRSWIKPEVIDLGGKLDPEKSAASETDLTAKLHEMTAVLLSRYDELAKNGFRNAGEYLDEGHHDMPFRPVIILGFEKLAASKLLPDAVELICGLAQKGRAAGIDLILCTADEALLKGMLAANFPAKLFFRNSDEKDFSFSSMTDPQISVPGKTDAVKLPEDWQELSLEEKYDIVNEKLDELADIDCDYLVTIRLNSYRSGGRYSYIEWSGESGWDDEDEFRPCQFVRKKPAELGEVKLEDFPEGLQEELRDEDWTGEDDPDMPNIINSRVDGKDWTECLEKLFQRLELLKNGYEICWRCEDYREEHRDYFKAHFED